MMRVAELTILHLIVFSVRTYTKEMSLKLLDFQSLTEYSKDLMGQFSLMAKQAQEKLIQWKARISLMKKQKV